MWLRLSSNIFEKTGHCRFLSLLVDIPRSVSRRPISQNFFKSWPNLSSKCLCGPERRVLIALPTLCGRFAYKQLSSSNGRTCCGLEIFGRCELAQKRSLRDLLTKLYGVLFFWEKQLRPFLFFLENACRAVDWLRRQHLNCHV